MDPVQRASRRLAAAMITLAIKDARRGLPCNGQCRPYGHVCADDALAFLHSDGCRSLLLLLDLDPDRLAKVVSGDVDEINQLQRAVGIRGWR